jgi:predicted porin
VPQQFNWLGREAPSNPLLEALLSVQEPSNLVVTTSLTEEVSDNFSHSPSDRRVDYRTGVALGTVYRLDTGRSFISLANTVRAFYQTRTDSSQFGFANLSFNAGYELPPWSFGLTDRFQRDDGTAQSATAPLLREDQNFIRNSISPQVRYEITPRTAATFRYTNTVVVDEDDDEGSYTSHAVAIGLRHQFSPNLTGNATYTFTTSQGSGASGGHSHRLTTAMGYTLDPKTSVDLSVFGTRVERTTTGGRDSLTYGASIGARRMLFTTISLSASIGPTVFQRQGEDARLRANWNVSLDGPIPLFATPTLTLTLTTSQRVQDTAGEVNDVGLVLRQLVAARLNYTPSAVLTGHIFAEYSRNELLEDVGTVGAVRGRMDNLWSAGMIASYTLTHVISLTGTYRYQRRDSNTVGNDFEENRVTVAVTGRFPIF